MKGLPTKLKGRLYSAFVHSVLMYNSEVWTITETEMKALVGRNGYLMRRLVGEVVRSADDKRLTESQLLEMLGLESIQSLIRKRKLQWVAHCARRGNTDLTWKRTVREFEDGKSKWGTRLKEEWKTLGVNTVRGWRNKVRIEVAWHPSWEGARRRERKRRPKRSRNTTCCDCCTIIHKTCLWIIMQHRFYAIKIVGRRELRMEGLRVGQEVGKVR